MLGKEPIGICRVRGDFLLKVGALIVASQLLHGVYTLYFSTEKRGKTVGSVLTSGIKSDLLCVFLPQGSAHSLSARCSFRNGIVLLAL